MRRARQRHRAGCVQRVGVGGPGSGQILSRLGIRQIGKPDRRRASRSGTDLLWMSSVSRCVVPGCERAVQSVEIRAVHRLAAACPGLAVQEEAGLIEKLRDRHVGAERDRAVLPVRGHRELAGAGAVASGSLSPGVSQSSSGRRSQVRVVRLRARQRRRLIVGQAGDALAGPALRQIDARSAASPPGSAGV